MPAALAPAAARRAFWAAAALLLAGKLALSAYLPISGDEAYFYYWGLIPDFGFYDHPPMVGWWLAALLRLSDAAWFIRLPATLLPFLAAAVAYAVVDAASREATRAWWAALIVLLAPAHLWNVFVTTDAPLVAFSLLSALAYLAALRRAGLAAALLHALAGVLLGFAFLSKYFAVFLGLAYLAHTALGRRDAGRWRHFALLVACALPGPALNLWWNSEHCWANLMFNLYNRHEGSGLNARTAPLYAATLTYVLSPFALFAAWRERGALAAALRQRGPAAALFWLAGVPFLLFAALSPLKTIGLHWLLSFVPLALTGLVLALPAEALPRLGRGFAGFALAHALVIGVLLALPLSTWKNSGAYAGLVLTFRAPELIARLAPLADDYVLASDGYSNAVTLGYNARRYFMVFGPGSSHARHDDILTDLRDLDGRNIAILRKSEPATDEYAPFFTQVTSERLEVEGARFTLIRGRGFRYETYRERVLTPIRERWYRIPGYLPLRRCYFFERYFPGQAFAPR